MDRLPPGHPSAADYPSRPSADSTWRQAIAGFAEAWQRHQERWPRPAEKPECAPTEPELERACENIKTAEHVITSWLRSIEAQHPGRILAGLEHSVKGQDRLVAKAKQDVVDKPGRSIEMALTLIPDAVRYTFCYEAEDYAVGVGDDIDRLKVAGFEMLKLKNLWSDSEYKGINSQWRDTWTGQRFEVQFHTAISFEAKELTHEAYERLRNPLPATNRHELLALHKLQREVAAKVPLPPGVENIRDQL